jgi:hypothetical protein
MAAPAMAETKTIRGEVVDSVCFMKDSANRGEAHAKCTMSCAKKGGQMAIAAQDGIYVISGAYAENNNAKLIEYVTKHVEATGEVTEAGGHKHIAVSSMKAAPAQ